MMYVFAGLVKVWCRSGSGVSFAFNFRSLITRFCTLSLTYHSLLHTFAHFSLTFAHLRFLFTH